MFEYLRYQESKLKMKEVIIVASETQRQQSISKKV